MEAGTITLDRPARCRSNRQASGPRHPRAAERSCSSAQPSPAPCQPQGQHSVERHVPAFAVEGAFALYQRYAPWRRPAWRWERARQLVEEGRRFNTRSDDALTEQAVRYLRSALRRRRCRCQDDEFAMIEAAHQVYQQDGDLRLAVEARLLAGQTMVEIASRVSVPTGVVAFYEALYFDVTSYLNAIDWIVGHAIGWAPGAGPNAVGALKWFAYSGGPLVLDLVWPYLVGPHSLVSGDELPPPRDLLDMKVRRAVAAALLPNKPEDTVKLFRLHGDLIRRQHPAAHGSLPVAPLTELSSPLSFRELELPSQQVPTPLDILLEAAVPSAMVGAFMARTGATFHSIAQSEANHDGVGETRTAGVLLPQSEARNEGPQDLRREWCDRPARRSGRRNATSRTASRPGAVGAGAVKDRGRCGVGAAA